MNPLIKAIEGKIKENEEKAQLAHDDHNSIDEGMYDRVLYELEELKTLAIAEQNRVIQELEALPHCCHSNVDKWIERKQVLRIVKGEKE